MNSSRVMRIVVTNIYKRPAASDFQKGDKHLGTTNHKRSEVELVEDRAILMIFILR